MFSPELEVSLKKFKNCINVYVSFGGTASHSKKSNDRIKNIFLN